MVFINMSVVIRMSVASINLLIKKYKAKLAWKWNQTHEISPKSQTGFRHNRKVQVFKNDQIDADN